MLRGIVLAAGESRRMGRPKAGLLVTPGGATFARAAVSTLQTAGLGEIVVVAGAHLEAVTTAVAGMPNVVVIPNANWAAGQLSSLLAGLTAVDSPDLEALVVALVDCPLVTPDTVDRLIATWRATRAPVVRPALAGRHGHPVVFDRAAFKALRDAPADVGAKAVVRHYGAAVVDVPVDDAGVLADIDTPGDYEAFVSGRV